MIITLNLTGEVAIYQQIRDQVVDAIARGALAPGESLPSVRQLAVNIGINMHTVNKAYSLLRDEGYLTLDRRNGARVALNLALDDRTAARIRENVCAAATEAYSRGMTKEAFSALCTSAYNKLADNS